MTVIEPDEMLAEVVLSPLPPKTGSKYNQVSRQHGGYAQAAVSSVVTLDENGSCKNVRLVFISVGEMPILSQNAPEMLVGRSAIGGSLSRRSPRLPMSEIDPGTDMHATAEYRRHLVRVLIVRSSHRGF